MRPVRARLHLDRRTIAGFALAVLAGALVFILTRPQPTVPILVAGAPLPAGVPLEGLAVEVRHVSDAAGLVVADSPADLDGWTLAVPLSAGEPLVPSLLRPPERRARPDVLALSLERDRAALGDLRAGDLVDVYVTDDTEDEPPTARLVAAAVYVVAAGPAPAGLGGDDRVDLLLAVDGPLAEALVAARSGGDLDLVRRSR